MRLTAISLVLFFLTGTSHAQSRDLPEVAVVCPLTPKASRPFGIAHLQGVVLALASSGMKENINLAIYDDEADPEKAEGIFHELSRKNVVAILGPCNSATSKSILKLNNFDVPTISSIATATSLTTPPLGKQWFFRANISDKERISSLLDHVFSPDRKAPVSKILVFYEKDDEFGEGLLTDTEAWLKQNKNEIYTNRFKKISYHRNVTDDDARDLARDVAGTHGENDVGILILGLAVDAVKIIDQLRNTRSTAQIFLPDPENEVIRNAAATGVDVTGVQFVSVWNPSDSRINKFSERFRSRYAEEAEFAAALGHDAASILFHVIKETPELISTKEKRLEIRNRLESYKYDRAHFTLAIPGFQSFHNNEFNAIALNAMQFDSNGHQLSWRDVPNKPKKSGEVLSRRTSTWEPEKWIIIGFLLAAAIGSGIRGFHEKSSPKKTLLKHFFSVRSLIFDPLISLSLATGTYFVLYKFYPASITLTSTNDNRIISTAFLAFALVLGYLGHTVILTVFSYIKTLLGANGNDRIRQ